MSKSGQASAQAFSRLRRFPRYRMDAHIQVAAFRDGGMVTLWGRTSELGQDGIGATLTGELTPGEVVSMEFPVPVAPHLVKVRAIVRYNQGLHCGFEFLIMSDELRQTLNRVCEMLASTY